MPDVAVLPMPDPMAKWTPVPDWTSARLDRSGWSAVPVLGLGLTVLAGRLEAALAAVAPDAASIGLFQAVATTPYAARIARDKALLVTTAPLGFVPGWNSDGWVATPADSGWMIFDLSGPALADVLAEATASDLTLASPSAATLFAGVPVLLVRLGDQSARLHLEVGSAPYIWRWLETRGD